MTTLQHPDQFNRTVRAFCLLVDLPEDDEIAEGKAWCVDDIPCSLLRDPLDHNSFFSVVDFGEAPRQADLLEQLLAHNHSRSGFDGPGFTVSPATRHVLHVHRHRLTNETARDLADHVARIAIRAVQWRRDLDAATAGSDATFASPSIQHKNGLSS